MLNTDVFCSITVSRETSRPLYTGIDIPLVDCFLEVCICETTLEVRTSDNGGASLRGRFCKHPVSLKRRLREINPVEL